MNNLSPTLPNRPLQTNPSPLFSESDGLDGSSVLMEYVRIALRWRWAILGVMAASVLLGLIITLLMTPQYTGVATIQISREGEQLTDFKGVERDASAADQEFYQTQYGLLRARTLSERVATQLGLVDDPAFFELFGVTRDDPAFSLANGSYPASGRPVRQRVAGEILLDNLTIDPGRLSRLVNISFTSPDPELSLKVPNAWGENFIQSNLERKVQATSYGRDLLQRQLTEYKERMDESQRQLVAYASDQQIINLPAQGSGDGSGTAERSIVADNLAALNAALTQAMADRIEAEARNSQARSGGSSAEALGNAAINSLRQQRAELAAQYEEMMVRFEPGYPAAQGIQSRIDQLDRAIAREEARVSGSITSDYRQALQREQALSAKVSQLKSDYLDLRRRSIQYNIFQQEVDTNRALYDGLLQRFKEIGVAGGVGVNNVTIIDPANMPQTPSSPRLLINLLVATIFGLGLGAAVAFWLEQMDDSIADPAEVERRLGLPLLGSVPKVDSGEPEDALRDPKSDLLDAYLAVQTSLSFTTEHGVPRAFAVTSTRPAEGKSISSLALASTLARGGRKVILVDGDMRSPSVHQLAGVTHDRGLSNFLAGDDNIDDMTFEMEDLRISAMSAGPIPPNAAELLAGKRLSVLLDRLLQTYDHVVIDSPPVMGLADAPLIGSNVEGVIYAVESHGIESRMVRTAIKRLVDSNVRIYGGILTKFEQRKSSYGYGYNYGYDYGREDQ